MSAVLDKCTIGQNNYGNLDFGVFQDKNEFRKSTKFAVDKVQTRIQEATAEGEVKAELLKKYVTGEECDTGIMPLGEVVYDTIMPIWPHL